ncbi:MAG: U32 family peptidase [Clostridia bacterium]|nr:U32 family peptidase [Clostridia bacterium]
MTELLAPCGSINEIRAAIYGGADAVYFGGKKFNARQSADNFSDEDITNAIKLCHLHNVKAYITLNTVVSDKEIGELIPFIRLLNDNGCDGVIIQSLGLMSVIKAVAPKLPVHASTQLTVHSLEGVKLMASLGFERVVVSRELSYENLKYICENSPVEIEAFIHGALCMCYSGQCYFSSVIGTRSGNRGSCAQPCRKLYKNGYELSLKDISMAQDFKKFLTLGVASFKIEGRLKSSDYVYGVTKTYRKLIDENRNATNTETDFLRALFSRQGFTNGYFNAQPSKEMFGIRTEDDKRLTEKIDVEIPQKKTPVSLYFTFKENQPLKISYSAGTVTVEKQGDLPQKAQKRAVTSEDIREKLTKTGDTEFTVTEINYDADDNLFIPVSALNNLRREALSELENALTQPKERPFYDTVPQKENENYDFYGYSITLQNENYISLLKDYESKIQTLWLPFNKITANHFGKTGILLPAIIKDNEAEQIKSVLKQLKAMGITKTYCRTYDAVKLSLDEGFTPSGGFSLNLFNSFDLIQAKNAGLIDAVISPECSIPVIRDIKKALPLRMIVYGRLPVMVTENCIIKNAQKCINYEGIYQLTDKTGAAFPVMCEYPHRNIILNSAPINLSDKMEEIYSLGISGVDFIFTDETEEEIKKVLFDYENKIPPQGKFTRGLYYRKI